MKLKYSELEPESKMRFDDFFDLVWILSQGGQGQSKEEMEIRYDRCMVVLFECEDCDVLVGEPCKDVPNADFTKNQIIHANRLVNMVELMSRFAFLKAISLSNHLAHELIQLGYQYGSIEFLKWKLHHIEDVEIVELELP